MFSLLNLVSSLFHYFNEQIVLLDKMNKKLLSLFVFVLLYAHALVAAPSVSSIFPVSGSITGGNPVTITGQGFTGTSLVLFGVHAATSFVVNSDASITAIAPQGSCGTIDITVSTPSGTSASSDADLYTYQGSWQAYITSCLSSTLTIVEIPSNKMTTVSLPSEITPGGIATAPGGKVAYVTDPRLNCIYPLTLSNYEVGAPIAVGSSPVTIAISPDGKAAYVISQNSNAIEVVDLSAQAIKSSFVVGTMPVGIAITPNGKFAYVTDSDSDRVCVVDLKTQTIVKTIQVGIAPFGIAITPNGKMAYVVNLVSASISVIDLETDAIVTTIADLDPGFFIDITPDSALAYMTSNAVDTVTVIDLATNSVVSTVSQMNAPFSVAISKDLSPVASFTVSVAACGKPTYFDASKSVSPVGTIACHKWDFGDLSAEECSSCSTSHIYTQQGIYNVTLTVVNSAGTSTSDTETVQEENTPQPLPHLLKAHTTKLTSAHLRGASVPKRTFANLQADHEERHFATLTQVIQVPALVPPNPPPQPGPKALAAPSKFIGKISKKRKGLRKHQVFLQTEWKKSKSSAIVRYEVYVSNLLVSSISNLKKLHQTYCIYKKSTRKKLKKELQQTYKIRAVNGAGETSSFIHLKMK